MTSESFRASLLQDVRQPSEESVLRYRSSLSYRCSSCDVDCFDSNDEKGIRITLTLRVPRKEESDDTDSHAIGQQTDHGTRAPTIIEPKMENYDFFVEVIYLANSLPPDLIQKKDLFERREEVKFNGPGDEKISESFPVGFFYRNDATILERQCPDDPSQTVAQRRNMRIQAELEKLHHRSSPENPPIAQPVATVVDVGSVAQELGLKLKEGRRVMVFFGAGLSNPYIPSGEALDEQKGKCRGVAVDPYVTELLSRPDSAKEHEKVDSDLLQAHERRKKAHLVENEGLFFRWVSLQEPSEAHCALAQMALRLNWILVTSNSDILLEKAGASAFRIYKTSGLPSLAGESGDICEVPEISTLLVVGLNKTEWVRAFRAKNPHVRFIFFDLRPADARECMEGDLMVIGNCQVTLPALAQKLEDFDENQFP